MTRTFEKMPENRFPKMLHQRNRTAEDATVVREKLWKEKF
jgi:hypothetical protein